MFSALSQFISKGVGGRSFLFKRGSFQSIHYYNYYNYTGNIFYKQNQNLILKKKDIKFIIQNITTQGKQQKLQLQQQQLQQQLQQLQQVRYKHSKTQIKRLFKNPKRDRLDKVYGIDRTPNPPPLIEFHPIWEPTLLPNGWSKPLPNDIERPIYPFTIERTKNKPNGAVGFLPVYSRLRKDGTKGYTVIKKIKGDKERFIQELRAVLQLSTPKNPKEDLIRIRTGGNIEIDGYYVWEVRKWLAGLGF